MTLRELAIRVRLDLRRSHFADRDKLIFEEILDLSFERDRPSARIPGLSYFTARTGITKGNVSASIERLVRAGAVIVKGDRYQILPQSPNAQWRVATRVDPVAADLALAGADRMNRCEQLELLAPIPDLSDALAVVSLEAVQSPTQTEQTTPRDWIAAMRQAADVPEMGTSFPNREHGRSRNGNTVPESGTACTAVPVQRSTVHGSSSLQERLNGVNSEPLALNQGQERELDVMEMVKACVGANDFSYWSGDWRVNWVRRYPISVIESACREFMANEAEGRVIKIRHAYLKELIRRFAPAVERTT